MLRKQLRKLQEETKAENGGARRLQQSDLADFNQKYFKPLVQKLSTRKLMTSSKTLAKSDESSLNFKILYTQY
jgi:hypothetical protein